MRARPGLALILLLAAPAATGQLPDGSIRRSVEVRVTNLDVVVTDKKGARVPGLTRDDFEVLEEGARRTITNFSAVGAAASAPAGAAESPPAAPAAPPGTAPPQTQPPRSWLVVFVDNLHLSVPYRNRALSQVLPLAGRAAASGVPVLVVTSDRSPKIRQKFTTDAVLLARALDEVSRDSAAGSRQDTRRRAAFAGIDGAVRDRKYASAEGQARQFAEEEAAEVDVSLRSLRATVDQLAALEGRKVLLHLSEGLPLSPGADAYEYLASVWPAQGQGVRTGVPRASGLDRGAQMEELAEAANAARVTIHAVDAAGLSRDDDGTGAEKMLATMGRVDPFRARVNRQSPLSLLAEETGGTAILNRSAISEPLAEVEQDLGSYYSLGYESAAADEDATLSVEVRVKRPGLKARARRSLRVKSDDSRVAEGVASALFFGRPENPFGASVEFGAPKPGGRPGLPVRIRVPSGRLPGAGSPGAPRGRLVFYFMARDEEDRTSDLVRQEKDVAPDAEVVHEALLVVRPGRQVISIGIRDVATGLASYLQRAVAVPPSR